MPRTPECPKCGSNMAAGFLLDQTYGGYVSGKWVGGSPVKSFWMGLKLRGQVRHEITSYRCSRCGYLESFAPAT